MVCILGNSMFNALSARPGIMKTGFTCNRLEGSKDACDRLECNPIVGDGWMRGTEACDDGNLISGDGCSSEAELECCFSVAFRKDDNGMETSYLPLITSTCGDGCLGGAEVCSSSVVYDHMSCLVVDS